MKLRSLVLSFAVSGLVLATACGGSGPRAGPTPVPVVKATTATVAGKSMTILVDAAKGMTLYWFTPDKAGQPTCTAGCLAVWPPLEMTDTTTKPTGDTGITGKL